jgi:Flp pilus assembly protein TadG
MMSILLSRKRSAETGAAFVELVVTLPVLVALLIGTADFARVFYTSIELTNAARAGAQFGAANLGNSGNFAMMASVAISSVNIPGVTVPTTPTRVCQCALADGSFPDTVDCGANPPTSVCPSPKFRVMTVTVTARATYSMVGRYPGVPSTLTIYRASTMRVTE